MAFDFSNTRFSLRRNPLSYARVRTALGPILRRVHFKFPKDGDYLNVGAGWEGHKDFFNIDWQMHDGVDMVADICRPLSIKSGIASGLFTEHCLEHIPLERAHFALTEFFRVLKPGAPIRVVVPDGEIYLDNYIRKQPLPYAEGDSFLQQYTPMLSVNRIFRAHGHLFIYDFETMSLLLRDAGFVDIRKESFGHGRDPKLLIDKATRAVESLYVEAKNPARLRHRLSSHAARVASA